MYPEITNKPCTCGGAVAKQAGQHLNQMIRAVLIGGGTVAYTGTAWHPGDLASRLTPLKPRSARRRKVVRRRLQRMLDQAFYGFAVRVQSPDPGWFRNYQCAAVEVQKTADRMRQDPAVEAVQVDGLTIKVRRRAVGLDVITMLVRFDAAPGD